MSPRELSQAAQAAKAKLTVRELGALESAIRRELRADVEAELKARRERAKANRGELETPQVASAARRMVRAVGKRAAFDLEGLAELASLRDEVEAQLVESIGQLRTGAQLVGPGYSWADVGRVLGITRQAAQQRFGK